MKKYIIFKLAVIPTVLILNSSIAQVQLIRTTQLNDFPSASAISFFDKRLYVLGDDAPNMLIVTNEHKKVGEKSLFRTKRKRINKEEKADLEASTIYSKGKKHYLIGISSFSDVKRNKVFVYNLGTPASRFKLNTLNEPFKNLNLGETNIEGAAVIKENLVLSNRANNKNTTNYLIITGVDPGKGVKASGASCMKIALPQQEGVIGVSGLEYVADKDLLLFVASTENTDKATEDGDIGESYIGCISKISQKLEREEIKADTLIPFSESANLDKHYKIESIALESANGDELTIHLAADNDDGRSTLFKVKWNLREMMNASNDK